MVMYQIHLHHGLSLSQSFVRAIWLSVAVAASKKGCKSQVILDHLEQNVKWQDTKGNPSVHGSCFSSHPKQRRVNLDHPKSDHQINRGPLSPRANFKTRFTSKPRVTSPRSFILETMEMPYPGSARMVKK
jgi:hypothetical protein